jgi:hypothetical protein
VSRKQHWKEFDDAGPEEVRRMVQGNLFAPEKMKSAREFLYQHDNKYQRRSDIKGTVALIVSFVALMVSIYAALKH